MKSMALWATTWAGVLLFGAGAVFLAAMVLRPQTSSSCSGFLGLGFDFASASSVAFAFAFPFPLGADIAGG